MPITLTPYTSSTLCKGHVWTIEDEDKLVELVAQVMLGKQRHVQKVLAGITTQAIAYRRNTIEEVCQKLILVAGQDPWHRDGLVFQIFSWLAANKSSSPNSIISAPHLIPAHKGFDGIQVDVIQSTNNVESVVIFEDKATENPRDTIRKDVWPEFEKLALGQRETELEQQICTLLDSLQAFDVDRAIETLIWLKVRKYRISITAANSHKSEKGLARLFKDYDSIINNSDIDYRRADCIYIDDLRVWMASFCDKVVKFLRLNVV